MKRLAKCDDTYSVGCRMMAFSDHQQNRGYIADLKKNFLISFLAVLSVLVLVVRLAYAN